MLRLYDARTGQAGELAAGRLLAVHVHGPNLRAHVTADVLRRVVDRRGQPVLISRDDVVLDWDETDLNIPPVEIRADPAADLHVVDTGTVVEGRRCLTVPPATGGGPDLVDTWRVDPLTARLAVLRARYRDPVGLDGTAVLRAEETLGEWRGLVSGWARSPSRPMCADYLAEATAALDDDLDTPTVLDVLARLAADPALPPGSKFETFSYLDMVLALDLVRDIGR